MGEVIERLLKLGEELTESQQEELDDICAKLERCYPEGIENLNNFKRELERQGLTNKKLEDFIENYMKFDNEI